MDVYRKTDCALRMLSLLAEGGEALLSVRSAADEVAVPYSYARTIQHALVQAGIVESVRGVHGGMRLKADPAALTLREVAEAVGDPACEDAATDDAASGSVGFSSCYHAIWAGVQALVGSYLDSVTLDDVLHGGRNPAVDPMFADRARFEEYTAPAFGAGAKADPSVA